MNKRKKKNLMLLLILVLFVSVGYALLSTTLNINGTTKVKNATWNIYWDNPEVTTGSVSTTKPTIDSLKTTASFNVELEKPGDFYEFTIDAKNEGTIDGMISAISYKLNDTEINETNKLPAYLNYTVTYSDDEELDTNHLLAANTSEKYKVRVEFKKDIENNQLPGSEVTLSLKFAVTYIQSDNNAVNRNESAITYITRQNEGQITPGDVIGIGETEDFYVISSTPEKTVLLAKYNLLVGIVAYDGSMIEEIQQTTPGYGLQSEEAVGGYARYGVNTNGNVAFSSAHYWDSGDWETSNLLSPYNANGASYSEKPYPYVYDSSLTTAPDFSNECDDSTNCFNTPGYSIAYYVEQYKTKLIEMGAPSTITARLLSYEEADPIKTIPRDDDPEYDDPNPIIFNEQSYWLGSASDTEQLWVHSYGYSPEFCGAQTSCGSTYYSYAGFNGVRPVIEIPTNKIK